MSLVELKNIHKSYKLGSSTVGALRGVTLSLKATEFTAVVGASGSGKSTLLNIVGLIDTPDSGTVWLGGSEVGNLGDTARARLRNERLGFIFQTFNLIDVLDVSQNVALPLTLQRTLSSREAADRVAQAIDSVGLTGFAKRRPDQLSGGQRQRVAIARALVTRPSLILADEPTANLDSVTAAQILDLMYELNQKEHMTFLFSTHDERLIRRVGRTLWIRDGQICEG